MQVILKVGAVDWIIADGAEHGLNKSVGPGADMRNSLRRNLQIDDLLRSQTNKITPRGNRSGRVSFTTTLECATIEAATYQSFAYPYNWPDQGDIWFVEGSRTIKLIGAGIDDISTAQVGRSVIITWNIVYSQATIT